MIDLMEHWWHGCDRFSLISFCLDRKKISENLSHPCYLYSIEAALISVVVQAAGLSANKIFVFAHVVRNKSDCR